MQRALATLLAAAAVAVAVDASYADDIAQTMASVAPGESTASSSATDCPDACIEIYAPVCGSDGVTYSNSCFLLIAQCENPGSKIVEVSDSACADEELAPEATTEASASSEADDCANRMCTMEYSPVCGSDGKTYSNSCMLELAQCADPSLEAVGDGECEARASSSSGDADVSVGSEAGSNDTVASDGSSGCPEMCTMQFNPVCGSDGSTYSNSCVLQVASCNNPELNLTQVSEGECPGAEATEEGDTSVDQTSV